MYYQISPSPTLTTCINYIVLYAVYLTIICLILYCTCTLYTEVISGIRDDVLEPLLLSPISSPPSSFKEVVKSVIGDIEVVLNGKHVDLKASIAKYFRALALEYFDEAVDSFPILRFVSFSTSQKQCGSQVLFNHIYTNTESASKLIDLLQNISVAVSVIKQVCI